MDDATCEARRQLDEEVCARCGLRWDVGDPDPPECPKRRGAVLPRRATPLPVRRLVRRGKRA